MLTGEKTVAAMGKTPKFTLPDRDELFGQAKEHYKVFDESNVGIKRDAFKGVVDDLDKKMTGLRLRERITPKAHDALQAMKEDLAKIKEGGTIGLQDLEGLRQVALDAAKSSEAAEREKAGHIIEHIDDFIDNLTHHQLAGNDFYPHGVLDKRVIDSLHSARDLWKRVSKGDELHELMRRAELSPSARTVAGPDSAIRNGFACLRKTRRRCAATLPKKGR